MICVCSSLNIYWSFDECVGVADNLSETEIIPHPDILAITLIHMTELWNFQLNLGGGMSGSSFLVLGLQCSKLLRWMFWRSQTVYYSMAEMMVWSRRTGIILRVFWCACTVKQHSSYAVRVGDTPNANRFFAISCLFVGNINIRSWGLCRGSFI